MFPKVTNQTIASYNPQPQAPSQTNLNPVPPYHLNSNQSVLNKPNSDQGGINQQGDQLSSPQHENRPAPSLDQQQVFYQGSLNQTTFNPQNYPKTNKPGTIRLNNTSIESSFYQGLLNQPAIYSNQEHTRVNTQNRRPASSSFSSTQSQTTVRPRPPYAGIGPWSRRDNNDYNYY